MHQMTVYYKPDNYPQWQLWREFPPGSFNMIGERGVLDLGGNPTLRPGFIPRIPFGKPAVNIDPTTKRELTRGYQFQIKIKGTGHMVLDRFRLHAKKIVEKSRSIS